jgi:hypothetical protein
MAFLRQLGSLYGAGDGFTGVSAGRSGFTGIGAGEGYTGVGAGEGYTGIGAGSGYTGAGAEEEGSTSAPVVQPEAPLVPVGPLLLYPLP